MLSLSNPTQLNFQITESFVSCKQLDNIVNNQDRARLLQALNDAKHLSEGLATRFDVQCKLLQDAEASAKAAEEKVIQDEADRQQRIKDSYSAQMPDEISQKVQAALQKEMVGCPFNYLARSSCD